MINVVCAYIEIDKHVFIARRATGGESVFGKWEFPGGKIEPNESPENAIKREIMEEFEVNIFPSEKLAEVSYSYPDKDVHLTLFKCDYVSGDFKMHDDHLEYTWVHKEDLLNYDLAAADKKLVEIINN